MKMNAPQEEAEDLVENLEVKNVGCLAGRSRNRGKFTCKIIQSVERWALEC